MSKSRSRTEFNRNNMCNIRQAILSGDRSCLWEFLQLIHCMKRVLMPCAGNKDSDELADWHSLTRPIYVIGNPDNPDWTELSLCCLCIELGAFTCIACHMLTQSYCKSTLYQHQIIFWVLATRAWKKCGILVWGWQKPIFCDWIWLWKDIKI